MRASYIPLAQSSNHDTLYLLTFISQYMFVVYLMTLPTSYYALSVVQFRTSFLWNGAWRHWVDRVVVSYSTFFMDISAAEDGTTKLPPNVGRQSPNEVAPSLRRTETSSSDHVASNDR